MKENKVVAVCDIMGFSNLLKENEIDIVVSTYIEWLKKAIFYSLYHQEYEHEKVNISDFNNNTHIGLVWFSDSIIVYTKNDNESSILELLSFIQHLVFYSLFETHVKIRVGLSYGEVIFEEENNLIWGLPIVEANLLQEAQNWSGGAIDKKMENRLNELSVNWNKKYSALIQEYNVPLKVDKKYKGIVSNYAINWPLGIIPLGFKLLFSRNEIDKNSHLYEMYNNTILFFEKQQGYSIRE